MKKIIIICSVLISCILCSCNINNSSELENTVAEPTTVDISELQNENEQLKNNTAELLKIYDNSLQKSIIEFTDIYLSYEGSALNNIDKVKPYVTEDYYSELVSKSGHAKNTNVSYRQSTAIDSIYYSDYSVPSNHCDIAALCYQTTVYNNTSETKTVLYIFNMTYNENSWLIAGVERPEA
ncbi:MAG: hypothetical protein ACI4W1_07790 [Ruminococcus sp.]